MAGASRAEVHRMNQGQNKQYKRVLALILFLGIGLGLVTGTFLNPSFMKGQITSNNNSAVIARQINGHFNALADYVGADAADDTNLLSEKEALPIANHVIDYVLGIHWLKTNSSSLAKTIYNDIQKDVTSDSSTDAQGIKKQLKEHQSSAVAYVTAAFDLSLVMLGANLVTILLVINIVIIVSVIIMLLSMIREMREMLSTRSMIHTIVAAGMWAAGWLILLSGIMAIIPVLFNVEAWNLGGVGYLIEIASSTFLDFVIVGTVLYIVCAIPWQATAAK
ncbi:hypothetical protein [Lactobacillus corticis]|nr:hypothetical protein [Lactobacillus corticis]